MNLVLHRCNYQHYCFQACLQVDRVLQNNFDPPFQSPVDLCPTSRVQVWTSSLKQPEFRFTSFSAVLSCWLAAYRISKKRAVELLAVAYFFFVSPLALAHASLLCSAIAWTSVLCTVATYKS